MYNTESRHPAVMTCVHQDARHPTVMTCVHQDDLFSLLPWLELHPPICFSRRLKRLLHAPRSTAKSQRREIFPGERLLPLGDEQPRIQGKSGSREGVEGSAGLFSLLVVRGA